MAVDFLRASDAAKAAAHAMTDVFTRSRNAGNTVTDNDVVIAAALFVAVMAEASGLAIDDLAMIAQQMEPQVRAARRDTAEAAQ